MIRTVYVALADRRTHKPLGVARIRTITAAVIAELPRGWKTYRGGEYIVAGTRWLLDGDERATPVLKVRGDELLRDLALLAAARLATVTAVAGHDRQLVEGRR